jgi:chromate transport protein ChrA
MFSFGGGLWPCFLLSKKEIVDNNQWIDFSQTF